MNYAKIQIDELEDFKADMQKHISDLRIFFEVNKDTYAFSDDENKWLDPKLNGLDDIETDALATIDAQIEALRGEIPATYISLGDK